MANIDIKSYNQILGDLVRKIIADTPANDLNRGSVLLTLLEAVAANDYENNTGILNVLELLNIDAIRNNDLEAYASNFGLTRNTATKSSGFIVVKDTAITKRSTSLYAVKPAPIAGSTVVYVSDATGWNTSGSIYVGRGTPNFEGPVSYSSITDNGTFFAINLSVALQKDHLLSEIVIDSQGTPDRQILAGTIVKIPSNNVSPEIKYSVLRDAVIPAGEDTSDSIPVVAINAGSSSNAGINTISLFDALPFLTATVTNTNAFTNGKDTESDEEFRDRIKAYANSLARGTKDSVISAVAGVSDETDGKQVESAVITEPAFIGDPSILYIDDGQGFEPSYKGQSVDLLVASASGNEEFLQLANYPIPRPQCINTQESPYLLLDSMELKVMVDDIEESIVFYSSDFKNISSATIYELATIINNKSTYFKCRFSENSTRLLLYPLDHRSETIKVVSDGNPLDANNVLKFPTTEFSYIKLYKNNKLLKEVEKPASLLTNVFSTWGINSPGNIVLSVDGTPDQDRSFTLTDFGVSTFSSVTLSDWARVFNYKFAGITATATNSGRIILTSNKEGENSTLEIIGGTYLDNMFGAQPTSAQGQNSDFILNRQNGNIQIKATINAGDTITAGSVDTRGSIVSNSASGGNFNFAVDANSRPSEIVLVADANDVIPRNMNVPIASTITITDEGSDVMRIMSSAVSSFVSIQTGDYVYITSRGETRADPLLDPPGSGTWLDVASTGLFKVHAKGEHLDDGVDSYIEVKNSNIIAGGPYSILDSLDIQSFYSDEYPQMWRGSILATPAAANIKDVVASLNTNLKNIEAKIYRTNYIKLTSATEKDGSIALPISVGAAAQIFTTGQGSQDGTDPHIASIKTEKDNVTLFKRSAPTSNNVWLDRHLYAEIKGSLTSSTEPSVDGSGTYSETLTDTATVDFLSDLDYDDTITITSGQNKGQTRDIKSVISSSQVGTRNATPRTLLDYAVGDEFSIVKGLELSHEDNAVIIMDNDFISKTIDMSLSRTGQINGGSQSLVFTPTNLAFSANDIDNEPGIDFGTLNVWGTLASQNSTNFNDYAVWFKARNWYSDNGAAIIIRAKDYGPIGDKITFGIDYPSVPSATKSLVQSTSAAGTSCRYIYGSGASVPTNVSAGDLFTLTSLGSYVFKLQFPATSDLSSINVNDLISIGQTSGFSSSNCGVFSVIAKNDTLKTVNIYSPNGVATVVGTPAIHTVQCVADIANSLNGTFFVLNAPNGDTVKFWYDNNDAGTIEPAIGTTTRSWEINVATGDTSIAVATLTAAAILNDAAFSTATNLSGTSNLITVTNSGNGPSLQGFDGTIPTSFMFSLSTAGIADTYEVLNIVNQLQAYPISGNDTSSIIAEINNSSMLEAVEKVAGTLYKSTGDITGTSVNGVAYDHDPDPLNDKNSFVSLWDSKNWVLTFQNSNPNFQLKKPLILSGASPLYQLDTTPNEDGSLGEKFKLIPLTLDNVRHQATHKALSQLDIVSDISQSDNNKKLQIKSQLLGSDGAIEVVGGRANGVLFKLLGDSEVVEYNSNKYLEMRIPVAPNTLSPGQHVILENELGAERLNRMISSDTMDVFETGSSVYNYMYNNKSTYFNEFTKFTIVDTNSIDPVAYPSAGIVWRWTHNDSGSYAIFSDVSAGITASSPSKYSASGLGLATNTHIVTEQAGTATEALSFTVTSSGQPVQGDYITFINSAGSSWAAWFSINGNLTAPTGATYLSATNKIIVSILSTDTPNQVISKLVSVLLTNSVSSAFNLDQSPAASLSEVLPGNLATLFSLAGVPSTGWSTGNFCQGFGSEVVGGLPIVAVDEAGKYIDVVNPNGRAMSLTELGTNDLLITATPSIEWRFAHSARNKIQYINIASNVAIAVTESPHGLDVGDTFVGIDIPSAASPNTNIVTGVLGTNQFTYASTNSDATSISPAGLILRPGEVRTRYKIESLNHNSIFRLSRTDGDSPKFKSCGVAADDLLILGGSSFGSINSGEFRVLAVDEDSIVYQNSNGAERLDTLISFNNYDLEPIWTSNDNQLTGVAGTFTNLSIGDWVKKTTDDTSLFVQVSAFNTALAKDATIVTLSSGYSGVTGSSPSHSLDQNTNIGKGVYLEKVTDIRVVEGDCVRINDNLFITENINSNWFESVNSGNFVIQDFGTDALSGRPYIKVNNGAGTEEQDVKMSVLNTRFSITEGPLNRFSSIKQVHHVSIDEYNANRRIVYLSGGDRGYKWNQTNSSAIRSLGKLGYDVNVVAGIDGYKYYTGLLQKVQRIIDGFEPDPTTFPGRKAIGSSVEILPPLPVRVSVAIDVTTQDGVNLSEISDEISSVIINYVSDLGVGEDVILSDIIVRVKGITGVAAVTFITPSPSNERISISDSQKAFIQPSDISIT
jgi:uncharacterized phage protein gp47/JayE